MIRPLHAGCKGPWMTVHSKVVRQLSVTFWPRSPSSTVGTSACAPAVQRSPRPHGGDLWVSSGGLEGRRKFAEFAVYLLLALLWVFGHTGASALEELRGTLGSAHDRSRRLWFPS